MQTSFGEGGAPRIPSVAATTLRRVRIALFHGSLGLGSGECPLPARDPKRAAARRTLAAMERERASS
jgi:hypothetical protein